MEFVELLAKSNFSFLQGASHPEEMALTARDLGYRGLALCDHNGLYGVVRAHQAIYHPSNFSVKNQIDALDRPFDFYVGCELLLPDHSLLNLIPTSKEGYGQLCQLITRAKRPANKGFSALQWSDLQQHSEDLLAIPLPPWSDSKIHLLQEIFADNLYIPVWKDYTWESLQIFQQACELESRFQLPLFATNRPLMHTTARKPIHDVLTCVMHKTTLNKAKSLLTSNRERCLRPLAELQFLWKDRPDLLQRTAEIAKRIEFSLDELRYQYPQASTPADKTSDVFLRELTYKGLSTRYPQGTPKKIVDIAEHELAIINELGYEDYFLTLWDICQFADRQGILHQGRGSAANSAVCYALGLTAVDPNKFELMFERFISRERGEPPDIDIDFESRRREEVIQYIYQKYGSDHAAMVSTVICYRSRMALRETAKVLEIPATVVSQLVRYMGREGFRQLVDNPDKLVELGVEKNKVNRLLQIASSLIGFPRHLGIHTGGFLIAQRPIYECVPVEKASMDGRYVIQWNKDDISLLKMMKIDVLGLGMLSALQKSFSLLKKHKNIDLDLYTIPNDDRPTYQMIQKADTVGVFQIESRAQMSLLPRMKPKNFYDLVIEVAIVRPGPIQGGMVHPFIRRRQGLEKPYYPHPDLESVLKRTLGVPIFQEQIMQIASAVCGFSPGEADELRRLLSSAWKLKNVVTDLRLRLINGMLAHGLKRTDAASIYQTIQGFASYGFPESHAASFALITYASCYLKRNHPEIFLVSLLNSQPMGFYPARMLIADSKRHGVQFLALCIQQSFFDYELENGKVRQGFLSLYGFRKEFSEKIVSERQRRRFTSIKDFVSRCQIPRSALLKLSAAGAFSCFGLSAREALWKVQALSLDSQSLLFGQQKERLDDPSGTDLNLQNIPKEKDWERLNRHYQMQGFSIEQHPMTLIRRQLQSSRTTAQPKPVQNLADSRNLKTMRSNSRVTIAGLLSFKQKPPTAKGFAFLTMEDEWGLINIVIPPAIYTRHREVMNYFALLEISGTLEKYQGVINIKAQFIKGLEFSG